TDSGEWDRGAAVATERLARPAPYVAGRRREQARYAEIIGRITDCLDELVAGYLVVIADGPPTHGGPAAVLLEPALPAPPPRPFAAFPRRTSPRRRPRPGGQALTPSPRSGTAWMRSRTRRVSGDPQSRGSQLDVTADLEHLSGRDSIESGGPGGVPR